MRSGGEPGAVERAEPGRRASGQSGGRPRPQHQKPDRIAQQGACDPALLLARSTLIKAIMSTSREGACLNKNECCGRPETYLIAIFLDFFFLVFFAFFAFFAFLAMSPPSIL
jgi:hypothetical protein